MINSKKHDNRNVSNNNFTVLCINQIDKYIFSLYIFKLTLNVGYNFKNKHHILKIIEEGIANI